MKTCQQPPSKPKLQYTKAAGGTQEQETQQNKSQSQNTQIKMQLELT